MSKEGEHISEPFSETLQWYLFLISDVPFPYKPLSRGHMFSRNTGTVFIQMYAIVVL